MSVAQWSPATQYPQGSVVSFNGFTYLAQLTNFRVPPTPATSPITWAIVNSGNNPAAGGSQTLSQTGNTVSLTNGGSVNIGQTTDVSNNTYKTSAQSYNDGGGFGLDITSFSSDVFVGNFGGQPRNLTVDGYVKPYKIYDWLDSEGIPGQVLSASTSIGSPTGAIEWINNSGGGATGATGATGSAGANGATGATGATGTSGYSTALANKILINQVPDPVGGVVNLTWSSGDPSNVYVPYNDPPAPGSLNTTLAPIDPASTGTGWRFSKTYSALPISSILANPLISGNTYTIISQGNPVLNWNAMGAAVSHPNGTQFLYNGTAPTGGTTTPGSAYASTKISWYSLNALYGVSLPTSLIPSIAIKKKNLRNAWFLVQMNADVALQGSFAIQIETYAYDFSGNTTNDYTGRWAYSVPLQQGQGFSAQTTTNITTAAGLLFPRLRSGFTYLLYAGDISPSYLPTQGAGSYMVGGAGLFAPSQVSTENTLRDPYELYTTYPHFALSATAYTPNATIPSFPTAEYTDPGDVEVASIYLNTSSTSPPVGVGQTTMDFNVMAFGYSGLVEGGGEQTFSYTTSWV